MKKLIAGALMVVLTTTICYAETFFWEDKKGIQTTDDVSKLPPKFREKYEKYKNNVPKKPSKAETTYPESAKNAVRALKKLEARCQAGISIRDYSTALGEAKFEVNMFVESKESNNFDSLKSSIIKTMKLYNSAGHFFEMSKLEASIETMKGNRVKAFEAQEKNNDLAWQDISEASKELAISFALLNK